ncbi:DUF2155 domain-containing protein [Methylobrevis albus]|uniref:DUF2155 domain-containing protein n=1 Tax=Methylobrevis albus TaxID=2793297 RepID=A0A931N171_9HYPH|nr:DUF2155 domain-containing protein [Methylobrevis albus]MBH0239994.1 DUF2155 domain-containing protein [Methylobrevis albus]
MTRDFARRSVLAAVVATSALTAASPAAADRIANPVAVFTGLDKITGRIITFDVYIDETVQFGALRVTPRVCYTRSPTEAPQTDAFVEVDEITLEQKIQRIFTGWMYAASPGLNAIEHPVYDVWLKDCRQESDVPPPSARDGEGGRAAQANVEDAEPPPVAADGAVPLPRPKPGVPAPALEEEVPLDPDMDAVED